MTQGKSLSNILFVIWDTTRIKNLPSYGYHRSTTPYLDDLIGDAILYKNAYSVSPWSLPSHASLFTGQYPSEHNVDRRRNNLKDVQTPVLAECLKKMGFQTVGFSCNTWICGEFGFDRGFDDFYYGWQLVPGKTNVFEINRQLQEAANRFEMTKLLASGFLKGDAINNILNGLYSYAAFLYDKGAWLTNRQVKSWMERDHDPEKPFFMFINYMEPHLRYHAPRAFRRRFMPSHIEEKRIKSLNQDALAYMTGALNMETEDFLLLEALYDAEISYLDLRFHELLKSLDERGLLEDTLVVITSDHGENIGEHGLMDHQYCLYETLLRVPMIFRFPPHMGLSHHVIDDLVEVKDIFYTLLDFVDFNDRDLEMDIPRRSLLPERLQQDTQRICIAEYLQPQPSIPELRARYPGINPVHLDRVLRSIVSTEGYKFIWSANGDHELYNLADDAHETMNLIGEFSDRSQALREVMDSKLPDLDQVEQNGRDSEQISPIIRKRLEDLGYM